jgi:hypothetical protein
LSDYAIGSLAERQRPPRQRLTEVEVGSRKLGAFTVERVPGETMFLNDHVKWAVEQPSIPIRICLFDREPMHYLGSFASCRVDGGSQAFDVHFLRMNGRFADVAVTMSDRLPSKTSDRSGDIEWVSRILHRRGAAGSKDMEKTPTYREGSSLLWRVAFAMLLDCPEIDISEVRNVMGVTISEGWLLAWESETERARSAEGNTTSLWVMDRGGVETAPKSLFNPDPSEADPSAGEMGAYSLSESIPPTHADTRLPVSVGKDSWWVEQTRCTKCGQRVILRLPQGPLSGDPPKPQGRFRCPTCKAKDSVTLMEM